VSEQAREAAQTAAAIAFELVGDVALKGIPRPVRLHRAMLAAREAAGMAEVAAAAGIARGTLYRYYPTLRLTRRLARQPSRSQPLPATLAARARKAGPRC
jgi:Bacterial regulatory proteins, tetR family